jgi:hypothetical protein
VSSNYLKGKFKAMTKPEKTKNRLTLDMDTRDCIVAMVDGNPGALSAVCELIKYNQVMGSVALCHLDDMEIYGSDIWLCYKDICNFDVKMLMDKIFDRSIKEDLVKLPYRHE